MTSTTVTEISIAQKISNAIELATEIKGDDNRDFCLASTLTGMLAENSVELGLSQILEERLSEAPMHRLIDKLNAIQQDLSEIQRVALEIQEA